MALRKTRANYFATTSLTQTDISNFYQIPRTTYASSVHTGKQPHPAVHEHGGLLYAGAAAIEEPRVEAELEAFLSESPYHNVAWLRQQIDYLRQAVARVEQQQADRKELMRRLLRTEMMTAHMAQQVALAPEAYPPGQQLWSQYQHQQAQQHRTQRLKAQWAKAERRLFRLRAELAAYKQLLAVAEEEEEAPNPSVQRTPNVERPTPNFEESLDMKIMGNVRRCRDTSNVSPIGTSQPPNQNDTPRKPNTARATSAEKIYGSPPQEQKKPPIRQPTRSTAVPLSIINYQLYRGTSFTIGTASRFIRRSRLSGSCVGRYTSSCCAA